VVIVAIARAAEPAAFPVLLAAAAILLPAPWLAIVVMVFVAAEPGGDLLAGAFKETAAVAATAIGATASGALLAPMRAFITGMSRIVTIVSHGHSSSSVCAGRPNPADPEVKNAPA
jgi:hypothetical protein